VIWLGLLPFYGDEISSRGEIEDGVILAGRGKEVLDS
jgi:hypothetical protein